MAMDGSRLATRYQILLRGRRSARIPSRWGRPACPDGPGGAPLRRSASLTGRSARTATLVHWMSTYGSSPACYVVSGQPRRNGSIPVGHGYAVLEGRLCARGSPGHGGGGAGTRLTATDRVQAVTNRRCHAKLPFQAPPGQLGGSRRATIMLGRFFSKFRRVFYACRQLNFPAACLVSV